MNFADSDLPNLLKYSIRTPPVQFFYPNFEAFKSNKPLRRRVDTFSLMVLAIVEIDPVAPKPEEFLNFFYIDMSIDLRFSVLGNWHVAVPYMCITLTFAQCGVLLPTKGPTITPPSSLFLPFCSYFS